MVTRPVPLHADPRQEKEMGRHLRKRRGPDRREPLLRKKAPTASANASKRSELQALTIPVPDIASPPNGAAAPGPNLAWCKLPSGHRPGTQQMTQGVRAPARSLQSSAWLNAPAAAAPARGRSHQHGRTGQPRPPRKGNWQADSVTVSRFVRSLRTHSFASWQAKLCPGPG